MNPPKVILCLEATSTYGFPVARHAHAAGHTVSLLQPLAVHRYAQATLARNKTDRQLAATLRADPALHRQTQLLHTIPAVGPVLCAGLLAELPADLRDARAATARAAPACAAAPP